LYFSVCKFAPFHRPEIERPYQEDGLGKQYYKCSTDENFVGSVYEGNSFFRTPYSGNYQQEVLALKY
jgi:hypothetical protein